MRARSNLLLASLLVLSACSAEFETLWPTGVLRMRGAGEPLAEEGSWSYYYPTGQLRETGEYRAGRRVGTWTQWFPNGQRASSGMRSNDSSAHASERQGTWSFWHENGRLRARGNYEAGQRTGPWMYHGNQGEVDQGRSGEYSRDIKQ